MNFKKKTLNRDIPIPLYYQLKEILLESIKHAEKGASFPTELELCEQFDVSRPTVRQAIIELVTEGYLRRIKGRGTFIAEPKIQQDFLIALKSFSEEMLEKGLTPTTQVLDLKSRACDEGVSEALDIPIGSEVVQLERLRFTNNRPVVLVVTFLPAARLPNILDRHFENESLYQIIEEEDEARHTRLSLLVSPEVGEVNEDEIVRTVLAELSKGADGNRMMANVWGQAKTIRVTRMCPIATERGKLLPLHLLKDK